MNNSFEKMHNASEEVYNKEYSTEEYCHEQSFKWGFQEGVEWDRKKLIEWIKENFYETMFTQIRYGADVLEPRVRCEFDTIDEVIESLNEFLGE